MPGSMFEVKVESIIHESFGRWILLFDSKVIQVDGMCLYRLWG